MVARIVLDGIGANIRKYDDMGHSASCRYR
jgi:hypothetical protein